MHVCLCWGRLQSQDVSPLFSYSCLFHPLIAKPSDGLKILNQSQKVDGKSTRTVFIDERGFDAKNAVGEKTISATGLYAMSSSSVSSTYNPALPFPNS